MKTDKLDIKILYELDRCGEVNLSSIAKSINRTKSFVKYRLDRMKQGKVLIDFFPIFDLGKLDHKIVDIYFLIKGSKNQEELLIDFFKKDPRINCIEKYIGDYNLYVSYFLKDLIELEDIMEHICDTFSEILLKYDVQIIHKTYTCSHNYLEYPDFINTIESNYNSGEHIPLSNNEIKLMKEIEKDPLETNIKISQKIGVDPKTIKTLKEGLKRKKILYAIRPSLDSNNNGFITKHIILTLKQNKYHKRKKVVNFFLNKKFTMFLSLFLNSNTITGELVFKDLAEFRDFERTLVSDFEDLVHEIHYLDKFEEVHYTYLPPEL